MDGRARTGRTAPTPGAHQAIGAFFVRERRNRAGYAWAVVGVAAASIAIAAITSLAHIANISLLYLPVVLALAARFGRGPAVLASVLAFLAYDYFFIPPVHTFTVANPAEWLSLFALLATALVTGQMTATVRARAREAEEGRARIARLYALAELIVVTNEPDALMEALVHRVVEVFAPTGVCGCALVLRDGGGVATRASWPDSGPLAERLRLPTREEAAQARYVLDHGAVVGAPPRASRSDENPVQIVYIPLETGRGVTGVLAVAGDDRARTLANPGGRTRQSPKGAHIASEDGEMAQQAALFATFCDQIALALDRLALQREAVHAEALREGDHLKNVLLGSVTHDLRTPIASIKAATSSLLQDDIVWDEADRREFLTAIDTSADRLNRLVGNLLDLSRLEAGVAQPEKDWYPIQDVIATVLDRLDLAGQTRDHHIALDIPDDLPSAPMDYAQMEQVLTNLIENALKYSPSGSTVTIAAHAQAVASTPSGGGAELVARVSDQGIGIAPSELEAIFDKFYRVQHVSLPWATGRPPIGTGLGLAIVANIIRAHGGRIWAESVPGHGATFTFTLPIPPDAPAGALPELPERQEPIAVGEPPASPEGVHT